MTDDILFRPLEFRSLTIKNRILRSNISGRFADRIATVSPLPKPR